MKQFLINAYILNYDGTIDVFTFFCVFTIATINLSAIIFGLFCLFKEFF